MILDAIANILAISLFGLIICAVLLITVAMWWMTR